MNYENMLTLKSRISRHDAGSLLDIAVGRGEFLKFAMGSFQTWRSAAGIDIDPESLAIANKEFVGTPVILILGSALAMPFANHYFDTVTMSNTLHHIEPLLSLFSETTRVIKPDGLIIINEMLNENFSDMPETYMLYHRFIAEMDNQLGRYHREPFTLKEIMAIIKSSKLQIMDQFVHSESTGDTMDTAEIEAMSDRLKNKVSLLRGTDCYYFYENKAREIIHRLQKSGIQRPRHIAFLLRAS